MTTDPSTAPPRPAGTGPGRFRASDADRDAVTEVLHAAYAEGRITLDEHAERTTAALAARTFDDLAALTDDLVPGPAAPAPQPPTSTKLVVTAGADPATDRVSAVMSTVRRQGPWRVRRQSVAHTVMGTIHLDLTQVTFDAPVVEINATCLLGTLVLRVPRGTNVRDETVSLVGNCTIRNVGAPDPTMPTVVLTGTNVGGEIRVRGPKKAFAWRGAVA